LAGSWHKGAAETNRFQTFSQLIQLSTKRI
jgi:hypothetical protein